jgi:hypothetical protein
MCGRLKQSRGRGLATRPSGKNSPLSPWQRARAARSQRGHRTWSARAVARLTVARWGLAGGKVMPTSTGGVPGRRRARRVETGLTEAVGRRWGGRKWSVQQCSMVAGWLWWSSTCGEGSCSTGAGGGRWGLLQFGNDEARRALTGEGEDGGGTRRNPMRGSGLRWPEAEVRARKRWGGRRRFRGGLERGR